MVGAQHPFRFHESLAVLLYLSRKIREDCHFIITDGDVALLPRYLQSRVPILIVQEFGNEGAGGSSLGKGSCRHVMCPFDQQHGGESIVAISVFEQLLREGCWVLTFHPLRETDEANITPPQPVLRVVLLSNKLGDLSLCAISFGLRWREGILKCTDSGLRLSDPVTKF